MRFTKMHGIGNDYVYVNGFAETVDRPVEVAQAVSDRHFAIGGDGLILICPPTDPAHDARMRMFNADGSEAEMCGNGVRCVAKYVYDHGIVRRERLLIETGRGPLAIDLKIEAGKAVAARVNMGAPILTASQIPTTLPGDPPILAPLAVGEHTLAVTAVSMGNPHAVTFVDALSDNWVLGVGPQVETHPAFPRRVNAEFVEVLSRSEVRMRVWERGSGETWACGTGACAVAVAGVLTGKTDRRILCHLRGGDLQLEWSEADNAVFMTGAATEVFSGDVDLPALLADWRARTAG